MDIVRVGKIASCSVGLIIVAAVSLLPARSGIQSVVPNTKGPNFAKDVQPLLMRKCMPCHGDVQAAGGFKLTHLKDAIKGGNSGSRGLVPHDPASSGVMKRITSTNPDLQMPPLHSGKLSMTPAEIAIMRSWIQAGPSWPETAEGSASSGDTHWSLQPLRRPALPKSVQPHLVDRFVVAKLAAKGLKMSPQAERTTLIRRVTFDIVGMPPTHQEIVNFVNDRKPNAFERVVDRLLASPRYGERWARHWLDTVHYADSHGGEHDIGRKHAWPYRDYVIQSFNSDIAYTRFVREQLAVDVFYPNRPDLTPALGYLSAGNFDLSAFYTAPIPFEIIDRDDMVNQAMSTFVSTTANCARCHDHKFDPIPTTDYWSLQAVFAGITKGNVAYEDRPDVNALRATYTKLKLVADSKNADVVLNSENKAITDRFVAAHRAFAGWRALPVLKALSSGGSTLSIAADGTISSSGKLPKQDAYTVTLAPQTGKFAAIRIDTLTSADLPKGGPGRADSGAFLLTGVTVHQILANGTREKISLARADGDTNEDKHEASDIIDGKEKSGWGIGPGYGQNHHAVLVLAKPVELRKADRLEVVLDQKNGGGQLLGRFRISVADGATEALCAVPAAVAPLLTATELPKSSEVDLAVFALKQTAVAGMAGLPASKMLYLAAKTVDVPDSGPRTLSTPREIHVLERGELSRPKQLVGPGALSMIPKIDGYFKRRNMKAEDQRRAALAEWFVDRENMLTWRSVVNRVWHYHFGKGIVDTPGDFGRMGGTPSHPELLDYLAVWFRDDAKGSIKQLHRLIVTSKAYQQTSDLRPEAVKLDTENRLLWRQNRHRLDADQYRDAALAVSGKLDLTMGGPSVDHFKSGPGPQMTPALDYAVFDWEAPEAARRSIYRTVWRAIADPFMDSLDFPDLGQLAPTRLTSVSALQALTLYNNNFVLSCSRALAQRAEKDGGLLPAQLERVSRMALGRALSKTERNVLLNLAYDQGLESACRVILNANAFLFID